MTPFNKTVITVASIILIIVLVVVLFLVISGQTEDKFPPMIPECPDYWTVSHENNKIVCKNTSGINIGTSDSEYEYDYPIYDDIETLACNGNLKKWAKQHGVVWDGITNKNNCPPEVNEEDKADEIKVSNRVIAAVVIGAIIIICVSLSSKK